MKEFKIRNWQGQFPGKPLPVYTALSQDEASELGIELAKRFRISYTSEDAAFTELFRRSNEVPEIYLEGEVTPLSSVFSRCAITPRESLFVQWRMFREVDRFKTRDLENDFYSIWYPSSDDIEIFDSTMEWVLFISHHGSVSLAKTKGKHSH